jgi:hypothetical protein
MNKDLGWICLAGVGSSVESSCECNTKHSYSINGREVLDQMSACELLSKDHHINCIVGANEMCHGYVISNYSCNSRTGISSL